MKEVIQPETKMKDLWTENIRLQEEKIELWSDPEYVLSKEEIKEAKEIVNDYYKNKYSRNMDSEAYEEFCKIGMLENKTRLGAGVAVGIYKSLPLWDLIEKGADKGFAWAEEQSGVELGYTFSDQIDVLEKQFPTAAKAGEGIGYISQLLALRGIFLESKAGKALWKAGEGMTAKLGLEGAAKAAAQKTVKSVVNITLDTMVDTLLKTIPHAIVNGIDGKSAEEIAKEALAETGESLAYNITGEVLAVMVENIAKGILKDKELLDNVDDICKGGRYASPNKIDSLLDGRPELTGSTREKLLATVQDPELSKIVNELYRPGATVGDGGTAAILVDEFSKGSSTHLLKATERLKQLKQLASSGKLGLNDLDVVEALIDDLESAISLYY